MARPSRRIGSAAGKALRSSSSSRACRTSAGHTLARAAIHGALRVAVPSSTKTPGPAGTRIFAILKQEFETTVRVDIIRRVGRIFKIVDASPSTTNSATSRDLIFASRGLRALRVQDESTCRQRFFGGCSK